MKTTYSTPIRLGTILFLCIALIACNQTSDIPKTDNQDLSSPDLTKAPAPSEPKVPANLVELILKDKLDGDLDYYCIDIKGGGPNIDPSRGLHAHTCFSYRGAIGSDQAIDPELFAGGLIKFVAFKVCATVANPVASREIDLKECDNSSAQKFIQSEQGRISPAQAPNLCFTVGTDTRFGRGGTSPHQIKSVSLQPCSVDLAKRQEWRTRKQGN